MNNSCDFLVIGSGVAGLAYALKVADLGRVVILAKSNLSETNSSMAQGGIAAVVSSEDSFEDHIQDTMKAGAGLCRQDIVKMVVEQSPARIKDLVDWGVQFDRDLSREGGHQRRRVLHVQDYTGNAIHSVLIKKCQEHPNIEILENQFAIDLINKQKVDPHYIGPNECIGCYTLDTKSFQVNSWTARIVVLATGGAGKVYLYTSNWKGATGDGIAMAYRLGARVANLEFMQFHPTCLYHPQANNFLITEALRGEGAELINHKGEAFMQRYDTQGSLAPRDIVARSIDAEMKKTGADCVYLDITHKSEEFIKSHFPVIYKKCLELNIDITKTPIPVVPAAHYLCGGVLTNEWGQTDVSRLFAIGETSCTGLHGANRLASNSLLECLVFSHQAAEYSRKNFLNLSMPNQIPPDWVYYGNENTDEMIVISHMWDEIRRLMWNYVGIVRSDKRLQRAAQRLANIRKEIKDYYWNFKVHPDILELRNIAQVAELTVKCALRRKESRGIHYSLDYNPLELEPKDTIIK